MNYDDHKTGLHNDNQLEFFKDMKDHEGLYLISNFGRIRSLPKLDTIGRRVPERLLKPQLLK